MGISPIHSYTGIRSLNGVVVKLTPEFAYVSVEMPSESMMTNIN